MSQFVQSIRHHASTLVDRTGSFFSLNTVQLLVGAGIITILLFVAAYIWWRGSAAALLRAPVDQSAITPADVDAKPQVSSEVEHDLGVDSQVAPGASTPHDSTGHSGLARGREVSEGQAQNVELRINGQEIPVPPNGTVHKDIPGVNGNASVDVSIQSDSSGSSSSRSSTSMDIELNSSTRSEGVDVE